MIRLPVGTSQLGYDEVLLHRITYQALDPQLFCEMVENRLSEIPRCGCQNVKCVAFPA